MLLPPEPHPKYCHTSPETKRLLCFPPTRCGHGMSSPCRPNVIPTPGSTRCAIMRAGSPATGPTVAWAIHAKPDGAGGWSVPAARASPPYHPRVAARCASWADRSELVRPLDAQPASCTLDRKAPVDHASRCHRSLPVGATRRAHPDRSALVALFGPRMPTSKSNPTRHARRA